MKFTEYRHPRTERSYWMTDGQQPIARMALESTGRYFHVDESMIKTDGDKGIHPGRTKP